MSQYLYYTSAVNATTLASSLGAAGSPSVNSVTGFPASYPFKLLIDWGLSSQEAILVTSAPTGTGPYTVPCTRGVDGTTAQVHTSGAQVVHGFSADELNILSSLSLVATGSRFGADPTGAADSTTAIQAALNVAPPGGEVLLPPGTFQTTAPLIIPPQVTLAGPHGSHIDATTCAIKPSAGFAGAAVILFVDQATGGYSVTSNQQRLLDLTLDCSNLPGSTIDGIQAQGLVHGVILDDLQIRNAPNHGIAFVTNGSGTAYSWRAHRVVVNTSRGHGFSPAITDSTWTDCESIGCGGNGINLAGSAANSHFIAFRAEFCAIGVSLSGAWAQGTGSGGVTFTALSTDRNTQDGVLITATGTVPVNFISAMLRRDGRNGNSGGGGFAGLRCSGSTVPVTIDGTCFPGVDDNGTGTNSPQNGFSIVSSSKNVVLKGGIWQGNTTGINDDGSNTNWFRGPNVLEATGATNAQVLAASYPATIADSVRAHGLAQPREHSLIAWSFDPANIASGKAGTSGTVYYSALYVNRAATAVKLLWGINTAGSGATAGQNFVGLFDSTGALKQSVGVDARVTSTGMFTETISVAVTPGLYWVGFLFNATGMPQVYRGQDLSATLMNANLTASVMRFATNSGAVGVTSLASVTPGNNTAAQFAYWCAIG